MVRDNLKDLPAHELADGFTIRWYRPGDERIWLSIHRLADRYNRFPPTLFRKQFGSDPAILQERQCYLLDPEGNEIGTATAWFDPDYEGGAWGRIHWVAILPAWQGKHLGKALMSAVCGRLQELRHTRAYLSTSTARVPAINLYLEFGFLPQIAKERDLDIWLRLERHLKQPLPWDRIGRRSDGFDGRGGPQRHP